MNGSREAARETLRGKHYPFLAEEGYTYAGLVEAEALMGKLR